MRNRTSGASLVNKIKKLTTMEYNNIVRKEHQRYDLLKEEERGPEPSLYVRCLVTRQCVCKLCNEPQVTVVQKGYGTWN